MKRRLLLGLLSAIAILASFPGTGIAHGAETYTLLHDGIERRYVIEKPAQTGPAPALVMLHGGMDTPARARGYTRFTLSRQGWVEIYPQGHQRYWSDGRRALSGGELRSTDDLGFLRALIDRLSRDGIIDRDRVYFVGASNGGAMVQRIICQAPELAAGAAVAIMNFPVGLDCPPGKSVPLMFMLGTEDTLVPFMGGPIGRGRKDRGGVMPGPDTLAFYARRHGCNGVTETALPDSDPKDGTRVRRIDYTGCAAPLRAFIIDGGGHTWPGMHVRPVLRRLLGRSSMDISGTAEVEAFFTNLNAH